MSRSGVKQGILGAILLSFVLEAAALPILGEIGFGGNFIPVDSSWSASGTASATGIDFNPNLLIVTTTTGDFIGTAGLGTIADFQFDPSLGINDGFGGVTSVTSIPDFWTAGGFSFELTTIAKGLTNSPDEFLVLEGTGTITAAGFDPTDGIWMFTGDTTNSGIFSWSAGSAAVTVPEPATLALLGMGLLIGAGSLRSRHKG